MVPVGVARHGVTGVHGATVHGAHAHGAVGAIAPTVHGAVVHGTVGVIVPTVHGAAGAAATTEIAQVHGVHGAATLTAHAPVHTVHALNLIAPAMKRVITVLAKNLVILRHLVQYLLVQISERTM